MKLVTFILAFPGRVRSAAASGIAMIKRSPHGSLLFSLAALIFFSIMLGGFSLYELQGVSLVFAKLTLWVFTVAYYEKIMCAMGDTDIDEDYERINQGNMAVSLYRTAERVMVGSAAAVLISKI